MPRFSKSRRTALAGGAALVLGAGVSAGVAAAQQQASQSTAIGVFGQAGDAQADVLFVSGEPGKDPGERRKDWLNAVASKLGVTPEKLDQAIQDVAQTQGFPPPLMVPFPPIGRADMPGTFQIKIDSPFGEAARAIGISDDQLKTEIAAGKSLADIARAHNIEPKVVGDALKAKRRSELDAAVAVGKLSKDMADRLKSHLDQEIDLLMQSPALGGRGIFHIERSVVDGTP
jgi:hypothetical protein